MKFEDDLPVTFESFLHLDACCTLIEQKYGKGLAADWKNGDYLKLSAAISRETGTHISSNTLKRIFGKIKTSSRYYPQRATRDALAHYVGFTGWKQLEERQTLSVPAEEISPNLPGKGQQNPPEQSTSTTNSYKKLLMLGGGILAGSFLLLALWLAIKPGEPGIAPGDIQLLCKNPVGGNPHSAIFKLELSPTLSGSSAAFTLDFGDGRQARLNSADTLITHYYEIPGRYFAALKYDNTTVDTAIVYLKTKGWTATASMTHDTTRVYPLNNAQLFKNGEMNVNASEIFHSGVDTGRTFFIHFVNSRPMNISGDNFELTADVRTSAPRPGVRCSGVALTIFGEQSRHTVYFIKPGCITWTRLRFSEIVRKGDRYDLSPLGVDLSSGGSLKIQVANRKAKVFINGEMVYQTQYTAPLKEIRGLKFLFSGTGSVHQVRLKDLANGTTYRSDFEDQKDRFE